MPGPNQQGHVRIVAGQVVTSHVQLDGLEPNPLNISEDKSSSLGRRKNRIPPGTFALRPLHENPLLQGFSRAPVNLPPTVTSNTLSTLSRGNAIAGICFCMSDENMHCVESAGD